MPRTKWKLCESGMVEEWGDEEGRRFGRRGVSLLEQMAEDPASGLEKLAPGVYLGPKAP
jgi:hypothetical protein